MNSNSQFFLFLGLLIVLAPLFIFLFIWFMTRTPTSLKKLKKQWAEQDRKVAEELENAMKRQKARARREFGPPTRGLPPPPYRGREIGAPTPGRPPPPNRGRGK